VSVQGKDKFVFETLWSHIGGAEVGHHSFSTPAVEEGEYSAARSGSLFQGKLTPSLLRGAGWAPERLWTFGGRKMCCWCRTSERPTKSLVTKLKQLSKSACGYTELVSAAAEGQHLNIGWLISEHGH